MINKTKGKRKTEKDRKKEKQHVKPYDSEE